MSAFPKADVQNVRIGIDLNVCLWPKADIRTESKSQFLDVRFGEKSGRSNPSDVSLGSTMSSDSGEISVPARAIAHGALIVTTLALKRW